MKMYKNMFNKILTISAIGGCSFYAGTLWQHRFNGNFSTKSQTCSISDNQQEVRSIFGTVFAATAIAPLDSNNNLPANSNRISEIMKYGFPGLDNVRSYSDYVLSYDRRTKVAHWVFEHLTPESVQSNDQVDRSKCDFMPDQSIHPYFRSLNSDYKGSGFDRGHLAAAGNHRTHQQHCNQTFYLTNMAPQVGRGFNRDSWNRLEKYVRKLARKNKNIYVCTGPLYLPQKDSDGKMYVKYQVIGPNSVAVPTHFYKVILIETNDGGMEMESYLMPNQVIDDQVPLKAFQIAPETIERYAGLLFFDKFSKDRLKQINGKKV